MSTDFTLRFSFALLLLLNLVTYGEIAVENPKIILKGINQELVLSVGPEIDSLTVEGIGSIPVKEGRASYTGVLSSPIHVHAGEETRSLEITIIPGILSLLPPLIAIAFAFVLKNVIIALFFGVLSGAILLSGFNPFTAFLQIFNTRFVEVLKDEGHLKVLLFTFLIAGFVGMIRKAGAMADLIGRLTLFVKTATSGMVTAWVAGLVIFFDDYANSLLLGNILRPLTDKLKISREKLSYLVDSTAAPVASLTVSTWIGTQISLMQDTTASLGMNVSGMELFLRSWPYNFYSLFTLAFVLMIAFLNRDYGPMRKAEKRSRATGRLNAEGAMPLQQEEQYFKDTLAKTAPYWTAGIAILSMVLSIAGMMYYTGGSSAGFDQPFREILNQADTMSALVAGPLAGILVFWILGFRSFTVDQATESLVQGAKSIFLAGIILTLAWSIGEICKEVETSTYLISILGGQVPAPVYPIVIFLLSAFISFCTGTSWGTMAVMFPIAIPLVFHALGSPAPELDTIFQASLAAILTGSVLGDHISPISDTTLFSSMACGADHIHHVKTQTPYALSVCFICLFLAYIPVALGAHWSLAWILGFGGCLASIRFLGKKNPV